MKKPHKQKAPKKGVAGKSTGAETRKAINAKVKSGSTLKQIGRASNRSASTISQIKQGDIKNPPKNLAANIRKAKTTKKK